MSKMFRRIGRRRALEGATAGIVALGLLLWWLLPLGEAAPSGAITISTGTQAGVYQQYAKLLRTALDKDMPDLKVTLQTSDGSQENVTRVANGDADFTIAAADAVETYKLQHRPNAGHLRGVARLYDDYVQLVVPRSSSIRTVADLRHRRVAVGGRGSGVRLIAERVAKAAGLDLEKDMKTVSTGIDGMPQALKDGDIDAFFWSGGLPTNHVRELSRSYPIRLVELGNLVDALHKQGGASRYYRAAVMPADAYPDAQEGVAVPTLAVANLLVTTDRTNPRLTEALTRTVIDSRDHIGAQVHAAQLVDLRTALYTDPLALHEGARRYYRSVKP